MSNFEKLYDCFQITSEGDNLRRLAEPAIHLRRSQERVIVETIIVEHGERRVVKTEAQGA
jgi:hypothetical protein